MNCSDVSCVIVTRGDRDLAPVLDSLPFDDIIVWDNSREQDQKVYGRYLAIERAKHDVIYTQDDDCLDDAADVVAAYSDGEVVCNVTEGHRKAYAGTGITLVGWGAVFHRRLVDFDRYLERYPLDDLFLRECDRVFTGLNRCREIDLGVKHLPYAQDNSRMGYEDRHGRDLQEIRRRLETLR